MNSCYVFNDEEIKEALTDWLNTHRDIDLTGLNIDHSIWFSKVKTEVNKPAQYRLTIEERKRATYDD